MENKEKDYLEILHEALDNASTDRATISAIATDCLKWIALSPERHATTGAVLAKYLDLMQKSTDQLIKVAQNMPKEVEEELDLDEVLEEIKEMHE